MKTIFIILFIILSFKSIAQDNIIQTDGTEIKAKVLEVEVNLIQYKRFDNLEGPTYSILKSQVFMIQYENGTRDIFNKVSSTTTDPIIAIKDSLEDTRIKSYIFVTTGVRFGLSPTQYMYLYGSNTRVTVIGLTQGVDVEAGHVFYFAPKKMPRNFGVGVNFTWLNSAVLFGYPLGYSTLTISTLCPYSSSFGPQISYQPIKKMVLDLYVKPGISLVFINDGFKPAFMAEAGINFRYKYFMFGVQGTIIPTLTDKFSYKDVNNIYRTLNNIPYTYSYIKVQIGVNIYR